MKKLSVFLVLLSSGAWATEFVDEWPFYTYSNVKPFEAVFNAISMVLSSNAYQEYWLSFALTVGAIVAGLKAAFTHEHKHLWGNVLFFTVLTGLIVGPAMLVNVNIIDKRVDYGVANYGGEPSYAVVGNVPFIIAAPASIGTVFGYSATNLIDTAMSGIGADTGTFSRMGYGQNLNLAYDLLPIMNFKRSGNVDINGTVAPCNTLNRYEICLDAYVQRCGVEPALIEPDLLNLIQNPANSTTYINNLAPANFGTSDTDRLIGPDGAEYGCVTFYNGHLEPSTIGIAQALETKAGDLLASQEIDITNAATDSMISKAYGLDDSQTYMTGVSRLADFAYTVAASKVAAKSIEKTAMGGDYALTDYTGDIVNLRKLENIKVEGSTSWSFLSQILPLAIPFIYAVAFAVSMFILVYALIQGFEKGMELIGRYMLELSLLGLYMPFLAMVDYIIDYFGGNNNDKLRAAADGGKLGSVDNLGYIYDNLSTMSGIAGILGVLVIVMLPAILATGKVSMMVTGAVSQLAGLARGGNYETAAQEAQRQEAMSTGGMGIQEADSHAGVKAALAKVGSWRATEPSDRGNVMNSAMASAMAETMREAEHGSRVNSADAIQSGRIAGAQQAGMQSGTARSMTTEQAYNTSHASASMDASQKIADFVSKHDQGLLTAYNLASDTAKNAMKNRSDMAAAEMRGVGERNALTTEEKDAVATSAGHAFSKGISAAEGTRDLVKEWGDERLQDSYRNATSMSGTKALAGTEAEMEKYGEQAKRTGKDLLEAVENVTSTLTKADVGSKIAGINAVGDASYVANAQTQAAGAQIASATEIARGVKEFGTFGEYKRQTTDLMTGTRAVQTKAEIDNWTPETSQNLYDAMSKQTDAHGNKVFDQAAVDKVFKNENGSIKSGTDMALAVRAGQVGNFEGQHSMVVDGKQVGFSVSDGQAEIRRIDGGNKVYTGQELDASYKKDIADHYTAGKQMNTMTLASMTSDKAGELFKAVQDGDWDKVEEIGKEFGEGFFDEDNWIKAGLMAGSGYGIYKAIKNHRVDDKKETSKSTSGGTGKDSKSGKSKNFHAIRNKIKSDAAAAENVTDAVEDVTDAPDSKKTEAGAGEADTKKPTSDTPKTVDPDKPINNGLSGRKSQQLNRELDDARVREARHETMGHNDMVQNIEKAENSGGWKTGGDIQEMKTPSGSPEIPDAPKTHTPKQGFFSGMLDEVKKMPVVGKVATVLTLGVTASQAADAYNKGDYLGAVAAVEPTGTVQATMDVAEQGNKTFDSIVNFGNAVAHETFGAPLNPANQARYGNMADKVKTAVNMEHSPSVQTTTPSVPVSDFKTDHTTTAIAVDERASNLAAPQADRVREGQVVGINPDTVKHLGENLGDPNLAQNYQAYRTQQETNGFNPKEQVIVGKMTDQGMAFNTVSQQHWNEYQDMQHHNNLMNNYNSGMTSQRPTAPAASQDNPLMTSSGGGMSIGGGNAMTSEERDTAIKSINSRSTEMEYSMTDQMEEMNQNLVDMKKEHDKQLKQIKARAGRGRS